MRKIISLICFLLPILAFAAEPDNHSDSRSDIRSDAPDRHIVVKGDTLWDISGKFFNDPWKWPHIWGVNKDTIKDPHWIYPGDVIFLDRSTGTLQVAQAVAVGSVNNVDNISSVSNVSSEIVTKRANSAVVMGNTVRLSPEVRESSSPHDVIQSIPPNVIAPFLARPLVIDATELENAPELLGTHENHVTFGSGDTGFVKGLPSDKGDKWQVYRPGQTFVDPETREVLGVEAVYLGNAEVTHFADVSTVAVTRSVQEIRAGDRLVVSSTEEASTYLPRAPESHISASVISIYGSISGIEAQGGQNSVITLNKGARDGLKSGHVLALYRKGEVVKRPAKSLFSWSKSYALPDERYGLVFVFRVFDKVSYALVMQTELPVLLLDHANTP